MATGQLARDLRVHPLAGIVEGRLAEPVTQERRRDDDDEREPEGREAAPEGREAAPGRVAAASAQVRDTSATPVTMSRMPAQRAPVTGSARNTWASSATTM